MMVREGFATGSGVCRQVDRHRAGPAESCSMRWGIERSACTGVPGGVRGVRGGGGGGRGRRPGCGTGRWRQHRREGRGCLGWPGAKGLGRGREISSMVAWVSAGAAAGGGATAPGARVGAGVTAGRGAVGAGPAAPGASPRFSRSETMRSTTEREASSSCVNWIAHARRERRAGRGGGLRLLHPADHALRTDDRLTRLQADLERQQGADGPGIAGADEETAPRHVDREALDELVDAFVRQADQQPDRLPLAPTFVGRTLHAPLNYPFRGVQGARRSFA